MSSFALPPLCLRATFDPESIDVEKRTVDLVWTTGAAVLRGYFDQFYEELSLDPDHVRMGRLQSGTAPLLDSHQDYTLRTVLGVVESATLRSDGGRATVRFARAEDHAEADQIFRRVQDRIIRNVSVGYRTYKMVKVADGEGQIPTLRAVDWEPYEISLVPLNSDAGAVVRAFDPRLPTNPCEVIGLAPEENRSMPHKPLAPAPSSVPVAVDAPPSPDRDAQLRKEAADAERARIAGIQRMADALALPEGFARRHIDGGTALDACRVAAIDEAAKRAPAVSDAGRVELVPGGDEREKWHRGAEAWLLTRSGYGQRVIDAAKARGETVVLDPGEFRGLSLVDLARQALARVGVGVKGLDKKKLVGLAFCQRGDAYATTGDFPVLLENAMHKVLQARYMTTADTWSRVCATGTVSDFRAHHRYQLGALGGLDDVPEHAEYKNLSVPDGEKQSITAGTKGNIISLSRQMMINDDLGAFMGQAGKLGRAAALTIELAFYALLAENGGLGPLMSDGKTLYHADHSNLGTGSALSESGLDADRQVMAEQMDPAAKEILDIRPAVLLVAIGLGALARKLNRAEFSIDPVDPGTDERNRFYEPNSVAGLFRDVVDSPRLSGTRRYLFAAADDVPSIEVAFLDGQRSPTIEVENGWRVDGTEYKVTLDFGIAAVDFRGTVTNTGTSG